MCDERREVSCDEGPQCPHCHHVQEEHTEFITYWGDGPEKCGCSKCGVEFHVEEQVDRVWISTPLARKAAISLLFAMCLIFSSSADAGWGYYPRPGPMPHLYSTPVRVHHARTMRHRRPVYRGLSLRMHRHYLKHAPQKYRRLLAQSRAYR